MQTALTEQPRLSLEFFSYGVLLRKREGEAVTEYPVDPAQIATALAARVTYDSGLLTGDTLLVRYSGVRQIVAEYRKPGKTGLYLEGSDTPLRIPLPGLVLIRATSEGRSPAYHLYAVKKRPETLAAPLFQAPLPNVFGTGNICWGTVEVVSKAALASASLAEDWARLLGSRFGDHGVFGKSKTYRDDIRQQWIALEQRNARVYPKSDLIADRRTLEQVLGDP